MLQEMELTKNSIKVEYGALMLLLASGTMKTLSFNDPCDYVVKGETDKEVLEKMTEHIKKHHPDEFKMELTSKDVLEKFVNSMRSKIATA